MTGAGPDGAAGPKPSLDRFEGGLLGLALGDALGAPYEGGPLERLVWRLIGTTDGRMRWTDDTQMSVDVATSLAELGALDPDDLAGRFARSYRWSRGYGPAAAKLLKRLRRGEDWRTANTQVHADGSFGNGGAMRAPAVGLFFAQRPAALADAARLQARVTHAHPLGMEGAALIAAATALAAQGHAPLEVFDGAAATCALEPFTARLTQARRWLQADEAPPLDEVRRQLGNGIAASESCVTALYLALRGFAQPFLALHDHVAELGGDADTVGAMAGALWGAAHGAQALPEATLARLEDHERLRALAGALHARA